MHVFDIIVSEKRIGNLHYEEILKSNDESFDKMRVFGIVVSKKRVESFQSEEILQSNDESFDKCVVVSKKCILRIEGILKPNDESFDKRSLNQMMNHLTNACLAFSAR